MSRDPEAESEANFLAWRAHESYDPSRNVPMHLWVSLCVKRGIWCMWRKKRDSHTVVGAEVWWEDVYIREVPERPLPIPQEDWQILVESRILRWPYDVIARRHSTTKRKIIHRLNAAEQKFLEAMREE